MPRKRNTQKVQTATGQEYGQAKEQADAQKLIPLPQNPDPAMRPGGLPFARPTERPMETGLGSTDVPDMRIPMQETERMKILSVLPVLSEIASLPDASPHLRNTIRMMRRQVGNVEEFGSKGYSVDE